MVGLGCYPGAYTLYFCQYPERCFPRHDCLHRSLDYHAGRIIILKQPGLKTSLPFPLNVWRSWQQ